MPTFAISRECDPALSLQEREMLTIQLIIGSSFMPSVRWIRSYAIERPDRLASVCVYEAPTKSILATFSRCWPVPFTEIREVRESIPDDFVAPESNRAPEGSRLYMIQRQFPADMTEEELGAVGMARRLLRINDPGHFVGAFLLGRGTQVQPLLLPRNLSRGPRGPCPPHRHARGRHR